MGCTTLEGGRRVSGASVPYNNIDGQVHGAAGEELQRALDRIAEGRRLPAPKQTTSSGPYRGALLPSSAGGRIACYTGDAVTTPAFGALRSFSRVIVHAIAPDGRMAQRSPELVALLRRTYSSAIQAASAAGATSLAIPSLGSGVNGWPAKRTAHIGTGAVAEWLEGQTTGSSSRVERLDLVLNSPEALRLWLACARERLGEPTVAETDSLSMAIWSSELSA